MWRMHFNWWAVGYFKWEFNMYHYLALYSISKRDLITTDSDYIHFKRNVTNTPAISQVSFMHFVSKIPIPLVRFYYTQELLSVIRLLFLNFQIVQNQYWWKDSTVYSNMTLHLPRLTADVLTLNNNLNDQHSTLFVFKLWSTTHHYSHSNSDQQQNSYKPEWLIGRCLCFTIQISIKFVLLIDLVNNYFYRKLFFTILFKLWSTS